MSARIDRLIRLSDDARILSEQDCETLAKRVFAMASGPGETHVNVMSWWNGELRWARNRTSLASDRRDIRVDVVRDVGVGRGQVTTNQLDDVSLESAVRAAERSAVLAPSLHRPPPVKPPLPKFDRPKTAIWSDATYAVTPEARGEAARALIEPAEAKGMYSAGYLEMRAGSRAMLSSERIGSKPAPWDVPYAAWTQAQCSMTVRDKEGSGSGWAGLSSYDWTKIAAPALASRALEKCIASQHPVALEPGRYTVILEPQAVAEMIAIIETSMFRITPELGDGPWVLGHDDVLGLWRSKLGLKVLDERITISHDPTDPLLGIFPEPWMEPLTWFDKGVLTNLSFARDYALETLNVNSARRPLTGYRMSGGPTSVEEMISTTTRGLLVSHFSNIRLLDGRSLLSTGLTRDGLWLIEHGKISKAVKNLRFTESPLFAFNSVDQLGEPVPVFRPVKNPYETERPLMPAIVPPIKSRDFSFTSTIDAI
jgi:predicted Zn-dependent protease